MPPHSTSSVLHYRLRALNQTLERQNMQIRYGLSHSTNGRRRTYTLTDQRGHHFKGDAATLEVVLRALDSLAMALYASAHKQEQD